MEKQELILNFMKDENYTPMKAKEMAMILGVPKKEYNQFLDIIRYLEENYKIVKNRKNIYYDKLIVNARSKAPVCKTEKIDID